MNPIIITYTFEASLQKVWDALSEEEALKKWYFPVEKYRFEKDKEFTFYESEDSKKYLHRCKFLNIIPQQLIEYTWEHPSHSEGSSVVKWELEKITDNDTKVTLTHSGIENFADAGADFSRENYMQGWDSIVGTMLRNYLYGIERLSFEIDIKAPAAKVWNILWGSDTYTQWTAPFCEGSYIKGNVVQGGRVQFLSPDGSGMYSEIVFCKENEFVIFKHIGMVKNHVELPVDDETKRWSGCHEIYKLKEESGSTHLKAEVDIVEAHADYMKKAFPPALGILKQLAEK